MLFTALSILIKTEVVHARYLINRMKYKISRDQVEPADFCILILCMSVDIGLTARMDRLT